MRTSYLLAICFLLLQAACAQSAKPHWDAYLVSKTLDTAHLPRLTEKETSMQVQQKLKAEADKKKWDSLDEVMEKKQIANGIGSTKEIQQKQAEMFKEEDEKARISDSLHPEFAEAQKQLLIDNRTSVTLTKDSPDNSESFGIIDYTSICESFLYKDTLRIIAGIGLMAGEGVQILINKNEFSASFGSNADGDSSFKTNLSEPVYVDNIEVAATHQQLTLLAKPTFIRGETICGYLEADFEPIYERKQENEKPVKQVNHAKIFFRCKVE